MADCCNNKACKIEALRARQSSTLFSDGVFSGVKDFNVHESFSLYRVMAVSYKSTPKAA